MDTTLLPLLSYLGWSFLPNLATTSLQSFYYRIALPAGTAPPQPGTARYASDHKRIRIAVLTLYLLYTLLQSLYDVKRAGDFYTVLSLSPYSTPPPSDKDIKSRLRRLAARYHPDKLISSSSQDESYFLTLRLASETLTTPSHKYAYTHFGPSILQYLPKPEGDNANLTAKQSTLQTADLVMLALKQRLPQFFITLLSVLALNTFFLPKKASGKFWRYLIICAGFVLEIYLLTHEVHALPIAFSAFLSILRNYTKIGDILPDHLLPFQILQVTGKFALSLNIFISQISVLFPSAAISGGEGGSEVRQWMAGLTNNLSLLQTTSQRLDGEASSLLQLQFAPFRGQAGHVNELRRSMKEGMVVGSVKGHPDVQAAVERAKTRKRLERNRDTRAVEGREDGADVVDLLGGDEQFI